MSRALIAGALALAACREPRTPSGGAEASVAPTAAPGDDGGPDDALPPAPPLAPTPLGLPDPPSPPHNPLTPAKVALGRALFADPALGAGATCAGCHQPARGFTDGLARSTTGAGRLDLRHTPSLWNVAYGDSWAWDGSMPSLEALILGHWRGQLDVDPVAITAALGATPRYRAHFNRAFAGAASPDRAAEALAAYLRTVLHGDAPWDRHEAGQPERVSAQVVAGARVFVERAGCAGCHVPPLYADAGFHPRRPASELDPGRQRVTGAAADRGAFATPTLRGALHTGPYFHDGGVATLEAAIDAELARDAVVLTPGERSALLAFVASLSAPLDAAPR